MSELRKVADALTALDRDSLTSAVEAALQQGFSADDILNGGLIAAMDVIGAKMESEEMFIPEVLKAAKLMKQAVERLKPLLTKADAGASASIVLGTVKGDLHDIGKNLVAVMLESAGFEVYDIGVDVPPDKFVTALQEKRAGLLGLSALLTTTTEMIRETIAAVRSSGLPKPVKILVGGAPVTREFADAAGADGYAADAGAAVKAAKALV